MSVSEYERDGERKKREGDQAKNVQRTTATLTFDKIDGLEWMDDDEWIKEKTQIRQA